MFADWCAGSTRNKWICFLLLLFTWSHVDDIAVCLAAQQSLNGTLLSEGDCFLSSSSLARQRHSKADEAPLPRESRCRMPQVLAMPSVAVQVPQEDLVTTLDPLYQFMSLQI